MAVAKPDRLTLRCYGVGFGDCFLLTFHYPGATGDRHMLVDFGSTQQPPNAQKKLMAKIAADIAGVVGPRLHVLVATHRHEDHISGFATNAKHDAPGDVIAGLEPQLVIQPWTEVPEAPADFEGTAPAFTAAANGAHRMALRRMSQVAATVLRQTRHLPRAAASEIQFIGANGLSNMAAVQNLARLGKKTRAAYVQYGSKVAALRTLLPGVKVSILGPPTIKQKADVLKQSRVNRQEYWHFSRFWKLRAATARLSTTAAADLFPRAEAYSSLRRMPVETRWFVQRLKTVRAAQLLGIVRAMDDALNNTSIILLLEAGKKKLLFPGDAQWENWELALKKDAARLKDVAVYKVGHHGSLNATPKTLWNGFARRSDQAADPLRLHTVMSTRTDSKHGHAESNTEVPRSTLVTALKEGSDHRSTQELEPAGGLVLTLELDLTTP